MVLLLIQLALGFLGFAVGRIGDKLGGHKEKLGPFPAPHHWIYGAILIVIGYLWNDPFWGGACLLFGVGHFISDLNDFLHGRFFGADVPHKWKFWNID